MVATPGIPSSPGVNPAPYAEDRGKLSKAGALNNCLRRVDTQIDMLDRRVETRLLCADLVDAQWKDPTGRLRRSVPNLEDISLSGACLQVALAGPLCTNFPTTYPN